MLCLPAALMAQDISKTDRATVETILNKYATGVQTGRIKVDSAAVDGDTLRLFASDNLTYLPLRSGNYSQIISDVKAALPQNVAGKAVKVHAYLAGVTALIASCQQPGDDSRQHITTSGGCHSTVARGVEYYMSVRKTQRRVMTFQDDVAMNVLSQVLGALQPLVTAIACYA